MRCPKCKVQELLELVLSSSPEGSYLVATILACQILNPGSGTSDAAVMGYDFVQERLLEVDEVTTAIERMGTQVVLERVEKSGEA